MTQGVGAGAPKKLDALTGLRIFAAAWVMLYHFRQITPTRTWHYPVVDVLIRDGSRAVDLFFVLSGFILSHVYDRQFRERLDRRRFRAFMTYRFARLYPVHLVTFAIMVALFFAERVLAHGSAGQAGRFTPLVFLTSLTLTHAWFNVDGPNMPAWSISAEWFAYLLFPLLSVAVARLRRAPLVLAIGAMALAELCDATGGFALVRVMAGFLLGMAVYRAHIAIGARRPRWLGAAAALAVLAWVALPGFPRLDVSLLLFAALILALASPADGLSRTLGSGWLVYLGEVSYALYMFHWVARVLVRVSLQKLGVFDSLPPGLVLACYALVAMVGAVLLYHFVERPGRQVIRRRAAPRDRRLERAELQTSSTTP